MPQVSVSVVNSLDRRTTFVVNPRAAAGKTGRCWASRESLLRNHFPLGEVLFTRGPGDAAHIAQDAVERGQDFIVAVGGDGTVHEVVNGMMAAEVPTSVLGVWPAGSGSDFARGVGIPGDVEQALDLLVSGKPRNVDVGRIFCHDEHGQAVDRYYINAADLGLGAVVCRRLQRPPKFLPGKPSYLWQTVRALFTYRNPVVELAVDNQPFSQRKITSVVLANNAYFGSGMCIAPGARIDDGEFDLVVVGNLGRFEAIRRLGETYSGNRIRHPEINYSQCKRLEVRSESQVFLEADGEMVGCLPAVFEIGARALKVVVGPTC
jgi:YegS/Rv2252/BmrU family lipid kinase